MSFTAGNQNLSEICIIMRDGTCNICLICLCRCATSPVYCVAFYFQENINAALAEKVLYLVDKQCLDDPHVKANLLFQVIFVPWWLIVILAVYIYIFLTRWTISFFHSCSFVCSLTFHSWSCQSQTTLQTWNQFWIKAYELFKLWSTFVQIVAGFQVRSHACIFYRWLCRYMTL